MEKGAVGKGAVEVTVRQGLWEKGLWEGAREGGVGEELWEGLWVRGCGNGQWEESVGTVGPLTCNGSDDGSTFSCKAPGGARIPETSSGPPTRSPLPPPAVGGNGLGGNSKVAPPGGYAGGASMRAGSEPLSPLGHAAPAVGNGMLVKPMYGPTPAAGSAQLAGTPSAGT